MNVINPFKSLRYNTDKVSLDMVAAPPYDIIDSQEQKSLYEKHENNIIRLILGDMHDDDTENNNRYTRAKEYLDSWSKEQILIEDDKPYFYILRQDYQIDDIKKSTYGIIAAVRLHKWEEGIILPHEKTLNKPKEDRLKLFKATSANLSPVYMLYEDDDRMADRFIELYTESNATLLSFIDTAGVVNSVWAMALDECIEFSTHINKKTLFIADGHHRYETSLAYKEYRESIDGKDDNAPYNFIMAYITGAIEDKITIVPTHRLLFNIGIDKIKPLVHSLEKYFDIKNIASYEEASTLMDKNFDKHSFTIYIKGQSFIFITLKENIDTCDLLNEKTKSLANLDVKILHSLILENMLGITVEEQASGTSISYMRDGKESIDKVNSGEYKAAILLNKTPLKSIIDISNDREVMPQKSTYFFPKLPSGIVMRKM